MKKALILFFIIFSYSHAWPQSYADSLTIALSKHAEASKIPGFSVSIVNATGSLYQKGFGMADRSSRTAFTPKTIQNLGSVSKAMVGLALVKTIEEGKLNMDTPINDVLPFEVINPYFPETPILVRHLANHTSSILDTKHYGKTYVVDESFQSSENVHQDFLAFLKSHEAIGLSDFLKQVLSKEGKWYRKKNFLKQEPGSTADYANLNAALAAYLITCATGTDFSSYCQSRIFEPLRMPRTSWEIDTTYAGQLATPYFPAGAEVPRYALITYPDGGLYANVEELSLFLSEMIKAFEGQSEFLPLAYARLLFPGDEDENRAFWGMGAESRNIGHGGSDPGVQTDLQFNADSKVGRIIIANVNAEDNEALWEDYKAIHRIVAKYENRLAGK